MKVYVTFGWTSYEFEHWKERDLNHQMKRFNCKNKRNWRTSKTKETGELSVKGKIQTYTLLFYLDSICYKFVSYIEKVLYAVIRILFVLRKTLWTSEYWIIHTSSGVRGTVWGFVKKHCKNTNSVLNFSYFRFS